VSGETKRCPFATERDRRLHRSGHGDVVWTVRCQLPAGHDGQHRSGDGRTDGAWSSVEPVDREGQAP